MGKVAFKLVAALKIMDAMTKQQVTDARIISCQGFKRINKENGIVVLVDDNQRPTEEVKEISVDSPYYQMVRVRLDDTVAGKLRKVWLVPGPRKGLKEAAAAISGKTVPHALVSCEFRENESGLRLVGDIKGTELSLATIGCVEPEGDMYLITDGKETRKIFVLEKLGEEDGAYRYRFFTSEPLPAMDWKKIRFYPIVAVEAGEDGSYYLPVCKGFDAEGWNAVLIFAKDGKMSEKKILVKAGARLTEDLLKL